MRTTATHTGEAMLKDVIAKLERRIEQLEQAAAPEAPR
jgi:hypothetical protein